ncbi:hypothetical protein [Nesterenkonia sp. K-15-9-6]|uniref:hypothetical protein n=1 Tax=Nesterenkonia sp. K-15-9-6 TaxID=3093918 RepID=UPI0040448699
MTPNNNDYYPTPPTPPGKPKRPGRGLKIAAIVTAPAALLAGCIGGVAIGASTDGAPAEPSATETVTHTPEPEIITETIEVEAEPEVITETITEEVEVEVTPEACTDALTEADELIDVYSESLSIGGDAIIAAYEWDSARLDELTEDLNTLREDRLEPALTRYYLNQIACEEG